MARLLLLDELGDTPAQRSIGLLQADLGGLDDESLGHFARAVVRDGDYRAVGDGGVVEQAGFELGGGDLEALLRWGVSSLVLGSVWTLGEGGQ